MKLPKGEYGLYLTHNDHKSVYDTLPEWLENCAAIYDWADEEAKQRAIETDCIWTLQWYPHSPIGFTAVAAPTLPELLEMVAEYCE